MWRRTVSGRGTVRHAPPYQRRSSLRERNEPHPGWRGGAGIGQTGLKYRRRYMRRRTEISDSTPGSKLGRRLTRGTQLRGMEGETTSSVDWRGVKGRSTKQRSGVRRVGGSGVLGSGNRRVSTRTLHQEVNERRRRAENPSPVGTGVRVPWGQAPSESPDGRSKQPQRKRSKSRRQRQISGPWQTRTH